MVSWYNFYKTRVNSEEYLKYFKQRYKPMIDVIVGFVPSVICEEGVGIGSLAKSLSDLATVPLIYGFDNDPLMIELATLNLKETKSKIIIYEDDIIKPKTMIYSSLVCTHGVLEHLSDEDIKIITDRYERRNIKHRVHYVPTEKYGTPSFGDERLLPVHHWLNLVKPKDYIIFNEGHDLLLID
jgi:2-polyprenyl-3-methyl-5-hydroxy-6-metoxy-1,4-benzoquinol methylase